MTSPVLTLRQLANRLRISESTAYRLVGGHQIPGFKLGARDWRFNVESVERWMRERTIDPRTVETAQTPRQ